MIISQVLEFNLNGQLQCVMNKLEPSISSGELARAESKGSALVGHNLQRFLVSKIDTIKMSATKKACLTKFTHLA
jgi:hypothetical protein